MKKDYEKLSFAVGPVLSPPGVLEVASHNAPYFRTAEFSQKMLETEKMLLTLADAPVGSSALFLTGSGTAGLEAAVLNTLTENDKALVVNGGSFGKRFVEILTVLRIPFEEIAITPGDTLTEADLDKYRDDDSFTAFVVNIGETSTGTLYDIDLISEFCRKKGLFLIVDAVSSFLADPVSMKKSGIGVMITGSQKALAVMPGVSVIFLSPEGIKRTENNTVRAFYLDLKPYLKDGKRGQTPFTPAVSTLLQIRRRVTEIALAGGAETEVNRVASLARYFRSKTDKYPFELFSASPSNAVTALKVTGETSAKEIFETLKNKYDIFVCPNGGELADSVFRVGHIGEITEKDYDTLFAALDDMVKEGLLK